MAGLGTSTIAPGIFVAGAAVAMTTAGGASLSALVAALIGSSVPNSQLRNYLTAVQEGALLLVVEVQDSDLDSMRLKLIQSFPQLRVNGTVDDPIPSL